jgi:hypothetical protein
MTVHGRTVKVRLAFALSAAIIAALLIPATAAAAPVLADSYPTSNWTGASGYIGAAYPAHGQSFTAITGTLDSAKFLLQDLQAGSTGSVYAQVYVHSGTYGTTSVPTGAPLATSTAVDVATIVNPVHPHNQLVTFSFDNTVWLTGGEKYVLVLRYEGATTNATVMGFHSGYTEHPGNMSDYPASGPWTPFAPNDYIFYVYETPGTPPEPPPVTSTPASSSWSLSLLALGGLGIALVTRKRMAR